MFEPGPFGDRTISGRKSVQVGGMAPRRVRHHQAHRREVMEQVALDQLDEGRGVAVQAVGAGHVDGRVHEALTGIIAGTGRRWSSDFATRR